MIPPIILASFLLGVSTPANHDGNSRWWEQPVAWLTNSTSPVVPPPAPIHDPRSYGAKGDGIAYDTESIQKAIDACAGSGGSVVFGPGRYLSAELTLKGGMTFHLGKGAVLVGGTNATDYPVLFPARSSAGANKRSLLYAAVANNLTIDGEGEIDGRCKEVQMSGVEAERPSLLRIFQSTNVTIRDITLRNPRMWTQVYCECTRLTLERVRVEAPPDCPNLDGMDICDCEDVVIRDCVINSEDDAVCLKSHDDRGLRNILVENNAIRSYRANAIKLGTASAGPVSGIVFRNNVVSGAKYGGLCLESVDGAVVKDITVDGLEMTHVSQPLFLRLANRKNLPGSMDGILINNVRATEPGSETRPSSSITGIPAAKMGSVALRNCYLEMPGGMTNVPSSPPERITNYPQSNIVGDPPASVLYVRHATNVILDHVVVSLAQPDVRPWLATEDAQVSTNACIQLGSKTP
jgi:polygalacturonase